MLFREVVEMGRGSKTRMSNHFSLDCNLSNREKVSRFEIEKYLNWSSQQKFQQSYPGRRIPKDVWTTWRKKKSTMLLLWGQRAFFKSLEFKNKRVPFCIKVFLHKISKLCQSPKRNIYLGKYKNWFGIIIFLKYSVLHSAVD